MGLGNRPYWREGGFSPAGGGHGRGGMRIGMPRPSPMILRIMILCGVIWLAQIIIVIAKGNLSVFFGATTKDWWQVWRYLTFQFLHSPESIRHIALNMLALYFFGMPLERAWGSRRFLRFYLWCGAFAGVSYVVMSWLLLPQSMWYTPLIGASGGVFAVLLACAVLFPGIRVMVLFIFPLSIRALAIIVFAGMVLVLLMGFSRGNVMANPGFWSDVAHLGGAVAAAVWIWGLPKVRQAGEEAREKANKGAWERKIRKQQAERGQIDFILDKIRREGIGNLTSKEKKILRDATERQRQEDRRIERM